MHYVLSSPAQPVPAGFSPIFWYLMKTFDPIANALLVLLALAAFALRKREAWRKTIQTVTERPATLAAAVFPLLCLGSIYVYRAHPLSMDEYSSLFQAEVFAAGKLSGMFPPELLDRLIPPGFQNIFLTVSRSTGEVSSTYWPGFALLLAPFVWLGVPWAANPFIGALTLPAIHRLTLEATDSRDAAGWAVLFTLASPAFMVNCLSFYAMPAHLLLNVLYALLLLKPTAARAIAAGLVGSLALNLHNPLPHLLFAVPFLAWLAARRGSLGTLACLLATYAVVGVTIGLGWKLYLGSLASETAVAAASAAPARSVVDLLIDQLSVFILPSASTVTRRITGLTKLWTWGAFGFVVLAAWGFWLARRSTAARLLGAALATTLLGYLAVPFDQGHGWGYRYLHSAWFALPVLAAVTLIAIARDRNDAPAAELRGMAAWGIALSLVLANGLRLVQVDAFVGRHLDQVPPLARPPAPATSEVVFVDPRSGFYSIDLIQNDPFLRGKRVVMLGRSSERLDELMAVHFPGHARAASGTWGEFWIRPRR